ncbi:MAG: hypothetical protein AMJ53_05130 [Gammaproteobacteria bacterium SG8_11]|nr:MAG: hypothetical protein AMJ53_05130 [Gammaproteobacteria bacterium SG8_11]
MFEVTAYVEDVLGSNFSQPTFRRSALRFGGIPGIAIDFVAYREQLGKQYQIGALLGSLLSPMAGADQVFSDTSVKADHLNSGETDLTWFHVGFVSIIF